MDSLTPRQSLPQPNIDPENPFPVTDVYAEPEKPDAGAAWARDVAARKAALAPFMSRPEDNPFPITDMYPESATAAGRSVTVKFGQTLERLAGTSDPKTLDRIAEYNGLRSRHEIRAGQSLVIPDSDTLAGVDVSSAVAKRGAAGAAYYAERQAERAAALASADSATIGSTVAADGMRIGPTRERAAKLHNDSLADARETIAVYERYLSWAENASGRVEAPPFAPDDLIGSGLGKLTLAGIGLGTRKLGTVFGNVLDKALAKQLIGDSGILKNNLLKAGIAVPNGFAAHHAIESRVVDQFPGLFKSAAEHGFDINAAKNGIPLPGSVSKAIESGLPLHRGRHLAEYGNSLQKELEVLQASLKMGEISARELPKRLDEISTIMKARLIEREVFLTRKDPWFQYFRQGK